MHWAVRYSIYLLIIVIVMHVSFGLFGPLGLLIAMILLFVAGIIKVHMSN